MKNKEITADILKKIEEKLKKGLKNYGKDKQFSEKIDKIFQEELK